MHHDFEHSKFQKNNRFHARIRCGSIFNEIDNLDIPKEVYDLLVEFERYERNQRRSDERHLEHRQLTQEEIFSRSLVTSSTSESIFFTNSFLNEFYGALDELTCKERERFWMHHLLGMSYVHIASIFSLSPVSIRKSVKSAEKKLSNALYHHRHPP